MRNAYLLLERRKQVGRIDSDSKLSVPTLKSQENGPGGHGVLFTDSGRKRKIADGESQVGERESVVESDGAALAELLVNCRTTSQPPGGIVTG